MTNVNNTPGLQSNDNYCAATAVYPVRATQIYDVPITYGPYVSVGTMVLTHPDGRPFDPCCHSLFFEERLHVSCLATHTVESLDKSIHNLGGDGQTDFQDAHLSRQKQHTDCVTNADL